MRFRIIEYNSIFYYWFSLQITQLIKLVLMDEVFFSQLIPLWPDQFQKQLVGHMAIPVIPIHAA